MTKSGSGTQTLSGLNTYTGDTSVTGGTLLVHGSTHANSDFTIGSSGTLGGSGTIAGTVNVSGVLAPGASVESIATGTLSMAAGSTLAFEIQDLSATGADLVDIAGDLGLNGTVDLDLVKLGGFAWTMGDKITLLSYTGAWNNGIFSYGSNPLSNNSTFDFDGETWVINYADSTKGNNYASEASGNYVTMTVVPEPPAAFLGGLGVLLLLRRRRAA